MAKPLAKFKPSSSARPQRPGLPTHHYAGLPGRGAPTPSNPRHNPNWTPGPHNAQCNISQNLSSQPYANQPAGGKGKGGEKGQNESQGNYVDTKFVSNTVPPIVTIIQTLTADKPPIIAEEIRCVACKVAKRPYEHSYMFCSFFSESDEAKNFQE